ncbi:hypothetical protein I551_4439 [Mycobacterium ulcerans str. Harvey]|uniref:Uncharacterized protein n=1 Tax=Mycobacterium ulcerans str. Harvey TaxID=1299332 RepID=A0ABP3ADW7_MYCUL|nr:hypothetical protein I551_4439 [Mycobacterium ulcerans str. Harvey]
MPHAEGFGESTVCDSLQRGLEDRVERLLVASTGHTGQDQPQGSGVVD